MHKNAVQILDSLVGSLVPLTLAEVHFLYWKLEGKQIN